MGHPIDPLPQHKPERKNQMEICEVEVRLSGSLLNTVIKRDVTPAEVMILRAMHGSDSIINPKVTGKENRNHKEEWERLRDIYGRDSEDLTSGEVKNVFLTVFPSPYNLNLPTKISDVLDLKVEAPEDRIARLREEADKLEQEELESMESEEHSQGAVLAS